jgi:hypothetical protein
MQTLGGAQGSRLASHRPASGDDEELFRATIQTEVTRIFVTNVDAAAATFRLHHCEEGDAPDQENALFFDVNVEPGTTVQIISEAAHSGIHLKEGDTLDVRVSTGGRLTFNAYGITASIAPGAGT